MLDLELAVNHALASNNEAVLDEQHRLLNKALSHQHLRDEARRKEQETNDILEAVQTPQTKQYLEAAERGYLFESALNAQKSGLWAKTRDTKDKSESFGWDAFNEDSLYRAYTKRMARLQKDAEE